MAYAVAPLGLNDVETAQDLTELANKIYVETLYAFERSCVFMNLVYNVTIPHGKSGQFIVGGKADGSRSGSYTAGTQVDVTVTGNSERTIVLGRPQYVAERVDQFEEKMGQFSIRSIVTQNHGQDLAIQLDKAIATKLEAAAAATGVAGNGDGSTITNTVIASGATTKDKGAALMEAIYDCTAAIRGNDYKGELFAAVSPSNYNLLVLSEILVNSDVTSNNGGMDSGRIGMVGNVTVVETNNLPTTVALEGLVFGKEAVGVLTLVGMSTDQEKQVDFLGATLMTAYYMNGIDVLRPACAAVILSA